MSGKREKSDRAERRRTARDEKKHGKASSPDAAYPLPARWSFMVGLASALGLLLGVVVIALNLISAAQPPTISASTGAVFTAGTVVGGQGPERRSRGSSDAPVVIDEWADFQCPACQIFALTREPALDEEYVKTGKVRFVYHNYAFIGQESIWAAEAAEAAADQGRYLEYRNLLWQRQKGENQGTFKIENLKAWAAELGLDMDKFNSALDQHIYRDAITAEEREGERQGINATPTLIINGRIIEGVPAIDRLKTLIEEELAKKR